MAIKIVFMTLQDGFVLNCKCSLIYFQFGIAIFKPDWFILMDSLGLINKDYHEWNIYSEFCKVKYYEGVKI